MSSVNSSDELATFYLQTAGVRGVHVDLGPAWREIHSKECYPERIRDLLGEGCAASALLTAHIKVEGRLSVQARGEGPIRTLFAECTAAGTLRGIAQENESPDGALRTDQTSLLAPGLLAITVENPGRTGGEPTRYQGLVPIESDRLAEAIERYFDQSEQLPTRIVLAATESRATGLMIQKLPGDAGDEDGWARMCALFDTLGPGEMLAIDRPTLLRRLFHDEALVEGTLRTLRFSCSCSRARVEAMLRALGHEEARASVVSGEAVIRCEFCGTTYRFSPDEVEAVLAGPDPTAAAPESLQ